MEIRQLSDSVCEKLGMERQLLVVANSIPTNSELVIGQNVSYPALYHPLNFLLLLEVVMLYTDYSNAGFVEANSETRVNFVEHTLNEILEYMSEDGEEYKTSQDNIKAAVKDINWLYGGAECHQKL